MIITGFREVSKYILNIKDRSSLTLDLHYVKPFPPNLYTIIIKNCDSTRLYTDRKQLRKQQGLKAKTSILLNAN